MAKLFTLGSLVRSGGGLVRRCHPLQLGWQDGGRGEVSRVPCMSSFLSDISIQKRNICRSSACFGKKAGEGDEYIEVPQPSKPSDDPLGRTIRILKHDIRSLYDKTQAPLLPFSSHVDILIIGGGIVGSTIAYFIKERTPSKALSVMVMEKDPKYTQSATALSVGTLRQKFSLKENIEMAKFGVEFLRNVPTSLNLDDKPAPDIKYHPYGCLQLGNEEQAPILQETFLMQKELGCHVELLTRQRLKERFPWMNTDDVELGLLGTEGEGWFDAWALHFGLKRKSYYLGTEYVQAEVVGFGYEDAHLAVAGIDYDERHMNARRVIVKTPHGEIRTVDFSKCVIAAGYESCSIAEMVKIGRGDRHLSVQLPVEARKRNVYCIQAPDGPGIDCPLVINTDGSYFRREGYAGHFVAGQAPPLEEKPYEEKIEVDYKYFENTLWPSLERRVPGFKELKLNSAWVGLYDYNRFDQSAVIGLHPYYSSIYFACGFSGYGIIMAPAIARATMEMILDGEFRTINLAQCEFERFIIGKKIKEELVA